MHSAKETGINCVLLKALPPVCIKYTALDESRDKYSTQLCLVLYLSRNSHQELYILYKPSGSVLSVLLYFTLTKVSQ